jgi:hypothetical protein
VNGYFGDRRETDAGEWSKEQVIFWEMRLTDRMGGFTIVSQWIIVIRHDYK